MIDDGRPLGSDRSRLFISGKVALPLEAASRATAILAIRGAGKTYCAAVLAEEADRCGVPIVVVDPVGVWWGLRSSADGTGPGLPVIIFGGDRAARVLEEGAALGPLEQTEPSRVAIAALDAARQEIWRLSRHTDHVWPDDAVLLQMRAAREKLAGELALDISDGIEEPEGQR